MIGDNGPTTALEAPNSLQLQLFANSTRQAPWDARLGFVPEQGFKLSLKGVLASGGNIPCLDIVIMRIYPLVYFEYPKEGGGKIVVRTERDERIAERAWEVSRLTDCSVVVRNGHGFTSPSPLSLFLRFISSYCYYFLESEGTSSS